MIPAFHVMDAAKPRAPIVNVLLAVLLVWSVGLRVWLATEGLQANHYWDERYNVKNLRQIVVGGELEPVSYYYTALSYLPQAALLASSQWIARRFDPGFAWFERGDLRPLGYLICRLVQVAYGAASILLTFLIGRRLFSPAAGLIAALFLAASPVHIRLSTFFKPDVLLLLLVLLALLLALQAAAAPTWRRYLLAGAGVGLAMSSKLNGGPIALPITIAALSWTRRDRSHLLKLAAAGVTAAVVFLLFNPHLDRYLGALERNQQIYAHHDRAAGLVGRAWQVARDTGAIFLSDAFHGRTIGLLAAAGAMLLVVKIARHRRDRDRALPWVMLLSFPLGYLAIYAFATAYAKPNNFLPLLPITSLLAALFVVELWAAVASRVAPLRLPVVRAVAAAALVVVVAAPAQAWVYESRTRSTWELAFDEVASALRPWGGRVAHFERLPSGVIWKQRALRSMVRVSPEAATIAARDRDQLDAAVFTSSGAGDEKVAVERWRRIDGAEVREVRPRLFRAHGPTLTVLLRAPELVAQRQIDRDGALATSDIAGGRWELPLEPPPPEGDLVSIAFTLPSVAPAPRLRRSATSGADPIELAAIPTGRVTQYQSRRIRRCPGEAAQAALALELGAPPPPRFTVTLYRFGADCAAPGGEVASPAEGDAAAGAEARR